VLLPACGRYAGALDEQWGARISSWGYVALTLDSFGPRGIKNCDNNVNAAATDLAFDAYRGLNFLMEQHIADPKRVAVVGFGPGAWQALSAVEHRAVEQASEHRFRAAAAFYPPCGYFKGVFDVPTLILIGERDDWAPADACRKMTAGEDDAGISRHKGEGAPVRLIVYPGAYFGFDNTALKTPVQYHGHHLEFNPAAAAQSSEALREFLHANIGSHP
jgi:dienelactone hydrolase